MERKDAVLRRLREAGDQAVSGQELAEELGVSRTAVWKMIRSLQNEGYEIGATSNRGYRLEGDLDRLSQTELQDGLPGVAVSVLQSVDSTNTEAKRRIVAGLDTPLLIVAEEQTAGRGRQGKSFYSPGGSGIYMTLVVHPDVPVTDAVSVTTRASVAVCRAIRRLTNAKPEIKWVNDLYLNGKKLCGILVEAVSDFESGVTRSLVIGAGVNITTEDFPAEVSGAALHPCGVSRNRLIVEIAKELLRETDDLRDRSYLEDYRAWSLVLGKPVVYTQNGQKKEAVAVEIDDNGGLIVENAAGERTTLQSGEISLRLQ